MKCILSSFYLDRKYLGHCFVAFVFIVIVVVSVTPVEKFWNFVNENPFGGYVDILLQNRSDDFSKVKIPPRSKSTDWRRSHIAPIPIFWSLHFCSSFILLDGRAPQRLCEKECVGRGKSSARPLEQLLLTQNNYGDYKNLMQKLNIFANARWFQCIFRLFSYLLLSDIPCSNSWAPRDFFSFSLVGQKRSCHGCQAISPYKSLETIRFRHSGLIPFCSRWQFLPLMFFLRQLLAQVLHIIPCKWQKNEKRWK